MFKNTYEFSWKGLEESKRTILDRLLLDPKKRTAIITVIGVSIYCEKVLAAGGNNEFSQVIRIAQEGLFYLGIFISLFGLYVTLLKKDDAGKKLIITAVLVYIGSYAVPKAFVLLQSLLSKI